MMFIVGFILGAFIIYAIQLIIKSKSKKVDEPKPRYTRRGIYSSSYSVTPTTHGITTGKTETVEVQFEVGELESTDKKSKIEIISCVANKSRYNTDGDKIDFIKLENYKWVDSDRIDWINTLASERNDKIDKILS